MKSLLGSFGLLNKVIAYVKDEGSNLASLIITLTSIVSCSILKLVFPFIGSCFGHGMSKVAQFAINETKVCVGMMEVNLKWAQTTLQKTIIWTKNSTKGMHEWKDVCHLIGFPTRIFKTLVKTWFTSHVILSHETLQHQDAISICYGRQVASHLSSWVPTNHTWAIVKIINKTLMPVVKQCVLNQSWDYWLLLDALHFAFSLNITMKVEACVIQAKNQSFITSDFQSKLMCFKPLGMLSQVVFILSPFLAFATSFFPTKAHNMLTMVLDLIFKGMKVVTEFVGNDALT